MRGEELDKFIYINDFTVKYSTLDNVTILFWSLYLQTSLSNNQIENFYLDRLDMCKKLDTYLKNSNDNLYSVESIIIKRNQTYIWDVLSDWNLFKDHVPFIADRVVYEGAKSIIGSKIKLMWESMKVECVLNIVKSEGNDKKMSNWVIELECSSDAKPKLPSQNLIFNVSKLSDKSTFVLFKHEFKEPIEHAYFQSLVKKKKNILNSLKKSLESKMCL